MGELLINLIPELLGLLITPAAIAGSVLLLQSRRPVANVLAFGGAFMITYTAIGLGALLAGATEGSEPAREAAPWVGISVGALFLAFGAVSAVRAGRERDTEPA